MGSLGVASIKEIMDMNRIISSLSHQTYYTSHTGSPGDPGGPCTRPGEPLNAPDNLLSKLSGSDPDNTSLLTTSFFQVSRQVVCLQD